MPDVIWRACRGCGRPTVEWAAGGPCCPDCADWQCPDPTCQYIGPATTHVKNLPPGHGWSAGQVAHAIYTRRRPANGHHA
jgi:hypothetical protein